MPSSMPNPWIDEGGQSDINPKGQQFLPFKRRYVKVHSPYADASSYQVIQALVAAPKAGWVSPGVEWISHVDQFPLDVDWAVRFTVTGADEVKRRNKKAESALEEQYKHQEGTATITGGGSDLGEIAETLAAYHASSTARQGGRGSGDGPVRSRRQPTSRRRRPGSSPTSTSAPTSSSRRPGRSGRALVGDDPRHRHRPHRPRAHPDHHRPGVRHRRAPGQQRARRREGRPLRREHLTARHTPILRDADGSIQADTSASFGVVAELGAGKSVCSSATWATPSTATAASSRSTAPRPRSTRPSRRACARTPRRSST
jgi:hypothetical protein